MWSTHTQQRLLTLSALSLVTILLMNHAVQADGLGCLLVDSQFSRTVFNLDSGKMSDPLPGTTAISVEAGAAYQIVFTDPAPDAKHDDYFIPAQSAADQSIGEQVTPEATTSTVRTFFVRPLDPLGPEVKVRDFTPAPDSKISTLWSADSQWLIYLWKDQANKYHLGLTGIDGKERQVIDLDSQADDQFLLDTGYPYTKPPTDDQFVQVFSKTVEGPIRVTSYALPSLKKQASFTPPVCTDDLSNRVNTCVYLSPRGHHVAYWGWTEQKDIENTPPQLVLYTPGTDTDVTFSLEQTKDIQAWRTQWSPDGQYFAVEDIDKGTFSVFGLDGSVSRNIASHFRIYECGDCAMPDPIEWSKDSSSVYYVEEDTQKKDHAMAFHVREKQTQTVIADLQDENPPLYTSDGHFVFSEWGTESAPYVGLVDTKTDQRIPFAQNWLALQFGLLRKASMAWAIWYDGGDSHLIWTTLPQLSRKEVILKAEEISSPPQFSQDEHWALVTTSNPQKIETFQAWLINLNMGSYRKIASIKSNLHGFLSPDNHTAIVYTKQDKNNPFLSIVPLDGRQPVVLHVEVDDVAFSPDASMLAYLDDAENTDDGHTHLHLVLRDGQQVKVFDPFPGVARPPQGSNLNVIKWITCRY